nr:capsid protein [Banfec virus 1]
MVYGKRYNRRRYRRNRKLTKANIYLNKSARSQAKQINALNRKISYIAKRDRPETKVLYKPPVGSVFSNSTLADTYAAFVQPIPTVGLTDNGMIGNIIKMKVLKVFVNLSYYNTSQTGYHDTSPAGAIIRFFALQAKDSTQKDTAPSIDTLLQFSGNTGSQYPTNLQSVCPFKTGISKTYRVLMDRRFTVTTDRNQCFKVFNIVPKIKSLRTFNNDSETQTYSGIIYYYIVTSNLEVDGNYSQYVQYNISSKLVYTDD